MKKLLLFCLIISLTGILSATTIFNEDFENGATNWTIVNGTVTNKWHVGTATANGGTHSIYISTDDQGQTHDYNITSSSVVHFYRDVTFPANAVNIVLNFDFLCGGETTFDWVRVFLHDTTFTPVAGTTAPTTDNMIGDMYYNFSNPWTTKTILIPSAQYAGTTKRLVFTWRNDASVGTQPPAAIDNIMITHAEAAPQPSPALLVAPANNSINRPNTQMLNWTAGEGSVPTGYKMFFGTTNPPTTMTDLGLVTSWVPVPAINFNTQYYWKVVPYNAEGDAANCPVWTFTTMEDPTITTFPYTQNFDTLTPPNLPLGWMSIMETTSTTAYVDVTTLGTPYSPPNQLRLANSADANALLIAHTPYVQNLNTKRLKLFAKGGVNFPLQIGVLSDPNNINSFTLIETINLTSAFVQYTVPLGNANGNYLAFRHGLGATYRTIYIDDVIIENLPEGADFSCPVTSLDFGQFMLNQTGIAQVSVTNLGSSPLIINHTLPAQITTNLPNPITIGAGQIQNITYTLTPTQVGAFTGNIVMNTNATNAPTYTIATTANILPPPPEGVVQIGSGDVVNQALPWEPFYRYTYSQTIYYPGEINRPNGESISSVSYHFNGNSVFSDLIEIYMGYTDNLSFETTTSWIPYEDLTLVFDGEVTTTNFTDQPNWIEIILDTPFTYNNSSNLVIAVREYLDGAYHGSNDDFYCHPVPTNRSIVNRNDTTVPDPQNPPVASFLRAFIPNTRLTFDPALEGAHLSISPTSIEYGDLVMNDPASTRIIRIRNVGSEQVTLNNITLGGDNPGDFAIANMPALPFVLSVAETYNLQVNHTPSVAGPRSATITIVDDISNTRNTTVITLSSNSIDYSIVAFPYTQNFDTLTPPALPPAWNVINNTSAGYVRTITTTTPNSLPNHLVMYNATDVTNNLIFSTPLIQDITEKRVKFFAKKGSGTDIESVIVGTITDPTDVSTFQEIETVQITALYEQYLVPLGSATGNRLAFKHPMLGTYDYIYIDDLIIETLPDGADFLCNTTAINYGQFMMNQIGLESINVLNVGAETLIINQELPEGITSNQVNPINVGPGQNQVITFTLTPTEVGPYTGTIVLNTNALNAPTYSIPVSANILPAPPEGVVQIGSGTVVNQNLPWEPFYRYTYSQTIYYPNEINRPHGESISAVFYHFNGNSVFSDLVQIYMGYTNQNVFETNSSWVPVNDLTLVFDGEVTTTNYTDQENWIEILLDTPFTYNANSNLVIAVREYQGGPYHGSADDFYCQAVNGNRSIVAYRDAEPAYELDNLPTGTLKQFIPNTRLTFDPVLEGAHISVTPSEIIYGDLVMNDPATPRIVRIRNVGTENVTINSITLGGDNPGDFTLSNIPQLPLVLAPVEMISLTVNHTPTVAGTRAATITIVDNINNNRNISRNTTVVNLTSNSIDYTITEFPYIQNFDNLTIPNLPPAWNVINTTTAGYVRTATTGQPYTEPNHIVMYNAADITNTLMFSTPVVTGITERRVRFYAKKGTGVDIEPLQVGTMTNPSDATTFQLLETLDLSSEYQFFTVALGGATGNRIAFKHPLTGTYDYIYIDNLSIENLPEGPDFYCAVSDLDYGNVFQFSPAQRFVNFQNLGSETLTLNINLPAHMTANLPNPINIPAASSQQVGFILTVPVLGAYNGVVSVTTNDTNNPNHSITVSANVIAGPPAGYVQIGAGEVLNQNLPWEPFYRYTYSQTIYYPHEINIPDGNLLTSVSYHYNGTGEITDLIKIYMGYTNQNTFTSTTSWIPLENLTLLFDGQVTSPAIDDWVEIEFEEEFVYNASQNLVIAVLEYQDGPYHSSNNDFYCTAVTGNRSLVNYNDSTVQDPASPPAGQLRAFIPNTRLQYEDDTFPRPRNLTGTPGNSEITLSWDAPNPPSRNSLVSLENNASRNSRTTLSSYKVYKNGQEVMLLPATQTTFTDYEVINGIPYTYFITAIYSNPEGESNSSNHIYLAPDGPVLNPPSSLLASVTNNVNVTLNWYRGQLALNESFETATLSHNWINLDSNGDDNKWEITNINPKEGYQSIMSRSRDITGAPLTPNNWLISPSFTVTTNTFLNYWIGAESQTNFAENYLLLISINGSSSANFETILVNEVLTSGTWQRRSVDLSAYNGMNVNIAFVHNNSTNQSALKLDGVQVVQPSTNYVRNTNNRVIGRRNIENIKNNERTLLGFKVYRNGQELTQVSASTFTYIDQNLPHGDFEYMITAVYSTGESSPGNVQVINITTIDDESVLPLVTQLKGNYPNPFNPETTISFDLAKDSKVVIDIFNIKGQKVTTLAKDDFKAGQHNLIWNGTDQNGRNVSSGVYFYKMSTENYNSINKMILMK